MKKVVLLAAIAAVTLSVSAQAKTVRHNQQMASNQGCWVPTDNRGFGWWDTCDPQTNRARALLNNQPTFAGFDGGGGGGGGGGGK